MVDIQRFLTSTKNNQRNSRLPLLNSLFVENNTGLNPAGKSNNFKTFMKWARRSPQLMGFLNIIATDMLSDDIEFKSVTNGSGRNKSINAEAFWKLNNGLGITEEMLYDWFINGLGYIWMGKIDEKELKSFIKKATKKVFINIEKKELEIKSKTIVEALKEQSADKMIKKIRHMAASTVTITNDRHDITGYVQKVGAWKATFDVDEVMEFRLIPFDGKVYPFAPMEALLSEVYLLWLITQNYVSFFENGGKPDSVFILPKELAGSKNHEYLINTLKKYKKIQNKHGNLVFTGDISVEKLAEFDEKMDNKDLGLYLVGVLAMMYGVPVSRIPFLVGKAANTGDAGGLADSGYWRQISVWQNKIEDVFNKELFIPFFGVKMRFKRGYLQDEVRESANDMTKTQVAEQRMSLGLWDLEAAGSYLNIDDEVITRAQAEKKARDDEALKTGMLLQNQQTNDNVMKNPDQKQKAKNRQDGQNKNQQDAGGKKINP